MKEKADVFFNILYKNIGLAAYVAVWAVLVAYFWLRVSGPTQTLDFIGNAFVVILPLASFAVELFYSVRKNKIRFVLPFICAVMQISGEFFTYQLANVMENRKWNSWNAPSLEAGLFSLLPALAGLAAGLVLERVIGYVFKKRFK